MEPARIYLTVIGLLYLGLAAWCVIRPAETSQTVGFELLGGSGRSEFLVIYGGLQLFLAWLHLDPVVRSQPVEPTLLSSLVLHGLLVVFRSISFVAFRNIQSGTIQLAVGEWVILLAALWFWFRR